MTLVQVQTTVEHQAQAQQLARQLVAEKLAACVQILGPLESHYRWQGQQEQAQEWLLLIKTTQACLPRLQQRLVELHPYELPQIIALPVLRAYEPYQQWVVENTTDEESSAQQP